jgi:hypothetical protein
MTVTLQQEGCLATAHQSDRHACGLSVVGNRDETRVVEVLVQGFGDGMDATVVSDKGRLDEPLLLCLQGTLEGWCFHRVDHGDRHSAGASGPDK